MNYQEYKALRTAGQIKAGIDNSAALRFVGHLPKRYQYSQYFWSSVWVLSIPVAIALMIFFKWWVGLLVLFVVTPAIFSSTKKSAAQYVLEHAEENEEFFNHLVENEVLVFSE